MEHPPKQPVSKIASGPLAALPSLYSFKKLLRKAADLGRITWSASFKARCLVFGDRPGYNTVDAVNAIRNGRIITKPKWDRHHGAWRCELADSIEGRSFIVDVGLDCLEDLDTSPRIIVITAYPRRGRPEVKDWSITK